MLPYERTSELFYDLFGTRLTASTIAGTNRACFEALKSSEEKIKDEITASAVVHFEETGLYAEGNRYWLHVASTKNLTYYACNPKRGKAATENIDILPNFNGTAVHDLPNTYFKYKCNHAICNVHHLRELKAIEECYSQKWASDMASLLLEIKKTVETKRVLSSKLEQDRIEVFKERYDKIIEAGLGQNPPVRIRDGPKKRVELKKAKPETYFAD